MEVKKTPDCTIRRTTNLLYSSAISTKRRGMNPKLHRYGYSCIGGSGAKLVIIFNCCTMKVVEIVKLGREMLELLQKSSIKVNYVNYLGMYEEYVSRKSEKKSYVVYCLSQKYGISERHVYYVIKKFEEDCNFCSSE